MKNKFFIFIHYFLIASSLIQISVTGDRITGIQFLLYLCFIILFNLRLFYINNKTLFFILCLADWALCFFLYITGLVIPFLLFLIPLIFLAVVSTSFFALSIAILIARIFKKESQLALASNITSLLTIVLFFLAIISVMPFVSIPAVFKNISMFSPLYWLMEMLDKEKLFPNILIVWAMTAAIFTAGSWKIKEFNNEIN